MTGSEDGGGIVPRRCWWAVAIRGLAALIFGIVALVWPGITLATIVTFFGLYVLIDGIFTIIFAFIHREWQRGWSTLTEGIMGFILGIIILFHTQLAISVISIIVVAWSLITGVLEILASRALPAGFPGKWSLLAGGILSVLFGCVVAASRTAFIVMIAWFIGTYALIFGAALIYLSYTLKCAASR